MNTPTIQDVNDIGCCCPFPECPGNRWQHQDRSNDYKTYGRGPWKRPAGADDDGLPEIYLTQDTEDGMPESGTASWYEGWNSNPTAYQFAELLQEVTITSGVDHIAVYQLQKTGNTSTDPSYSPATPFAEDSIMADGQLTHIYSLARDPCWATNLADSTAIVVSANWDVTEPVWRRNYDTVRYSTSATPHSLQGAGGQSDIAVYSFDVTVESFLQFILSGPFTREQFTHLAAEDLLTKLYDGVSISVPQASFDLIWPLVGDFIWFDGPSFLSDPIVESQPIHNHTLADADMIGTKYKVGIPEDWAIANAAFKAWKTAHATWEAADHATRGDEPVKPSGKRTVFECQWQEIFIPKKWQEYKAALGIYEADHATYLTDHQTWMDLPEDERGDEPTDAVSPTEPTDAEDRPSLAMDREWTYGGVDAEPFSGEFMMTQPTAPGKTRPMNMLIICYHATAVGVKPTSHGEVIDLENP